MPATSRPSHAPFSSALLPGTGVCPLFRAEQAGGRDPPPARPAAPLRGLPAPALSRPPARLQLAGVHGRPSSEGGGTSRGGGRAARWARGPEGRRAAQRPTARATPAGKLCSRRASWVRRHRSAASRGRQQCGASCPGAECSLVRSSRFLSLTEHQPLPSSSCDVRQRGGVRVNPLQNRRPSPRQAQPPPNRTHLPASGGVRPQATAAGSSSVAHWLRRCPFRRLSARQRAGGLPALLRS